MDEIQSVSGDLSGMNYRHNVSYLFLPFRFGVAKGDAAAAWQEALGIAKDNYTDASGHYEFPDHFWHKYLFRYVAEKYDMRDEENCRCVHLLYRDWETQTLMLKRDECFQGTDILYTGPEYQEGRHELYPFRILDAEVYLFRYGVGMLIFKIAVCGRLVWNGTDYMDAKTEVTAFDISEALHCLKRTSSGQIYLNRKQQNIRHSLNEISERLLDHFFGGRLNYELFFYLDRKNSRANFMTYLPAKNDDDWERELFYLRNGHSRSYTYIRESGGEKEIYRMTAETTWGMTAEGLVCRHVYTDVKFDEIFYRNFCGQYLFLYVMILFQRYEMYKLLSDIHSDSGIEQLEAYQQELSVFNTDFVYMTVSEVPQYRMLYDRIRRVMHLDEMFLHDINDPVVRLRELREKQHQKQTEEIAANQKKQDQAMNAVLFALALLGIFSAFADSFSFIQGVSGLMDGGPLVRLFQIICIVLIAGIMIWIIYKLRRKK